VFAVAKIMRPESRDHTPLAERWLEALLFSSRWLMAPFYLGLVVALGALLIVFSTSSRLKSRTFVEITPESAILMGLSLIAPILSSRSNRIARGNFMGPILSHPQRIAVGSPVASVLRGQDRGGRSLVRLELFRLAKAEKRSKTVALFFIDRKYSHHAAAPERILASGTA
jgi:hypothetical protein